MVQGFAIANDTDHSTFQELAKFPDRSKRFDTTMTSMRNSPGFEPKHLVQAFSWRDMHIKVFVDIGGSHGKFSIALAQDLPDLQCIVQDLPEVVAEGEARLPVDLKSRVSFMPHDFFVEQPVKAADVYFLRWIFHDWSDRYCILLLQALIPALKHGARIIVAELLVPPPGLVAPYKEWIVR